MDIILKPNETACIKENKPILYKKVVQKTEIDKNEFKNLLQDFIKKPL